MLLSFTIHSKNLMVFLCLEAFNSQIYLVFLFVNGLLIYENDVCVATSLNAFSFSLSFQNAVNNCVDQYLYIFPAHVRYSAVYCNSFQCGMAVDVFPERESSLL